MRTTRNDVQRALEYGRSKNELIDNIINYIMNMAFDADEAEQMLNDILGPEIEGARMTYSDISRILTRKG